MDSKLAIQWFIEQHADWEKLLSEKPYALTVSRDELFGRHLIMFKYSMIDSDFSLKVVQECRGLVLDEDTLESVSVPFFKFFNFGESHAAAIDWTTAQVATKIDGSLIKIVRLGDNLLVSTNGTIDAFKAPVAEQIGCEFKSFGDIVDYVLKSKHVDAAMFEPGWTYMFELVSPFTRVVIPYKETDLYYLGRRSNATFQEEHFKEDPFNGVFYAPTIFPLKSIDECLAATKAMPWDEEGYVVCDAKFNRVKVKSTAYLAAHRLKGNGVLSYARALELVRINEIDEVIAYFPEFEEALLECKSRFWKLVDRAKNAVLELDVWKKANGFDKQPWLIESGGQKRKDLACWVMNEHANLSGMLFGIVDGKIASAESFFMEVPTEKILRMLGYKE